MKIYKKVLGTLEKAYATSIMPINGMLNFIAATEGHGACLRFPMDTLQSQIVWVEPGGTMNIVPIPGTENEFVATQKFFPTFQAQESVLVHAKYANDGCWQVTPIMKIPYLHRFDIFKIGNALYFIGATLCEQKEFKEDWSKPGKVLIGRLENPITKPFHLQPVLEGITKNHGFCHGVWKEREAVLFSGEEGVFVVYIPATQQDSWEWEKILEHEVSDIAVCDIDGDGVLELATIEGFHGDKGRIYKKVDGKLVVIHEHAYEFGHVVWGGKIAGKPSFIIGGRKGNRHVVIFQYDKQSGVIREHLVDCIGGPSNIAVANLSDRDVILAANREIGQIALYEIWA